MICSACQAPNDAAAGSCIACGQPVRETSLLTQETKAVPLTRFIRCAAVLTALAPSLWAVECPPKQAGPSPEYSKLVNRYQSGDHSGAIVALGGWDEVRLKCDLEDLRDAAARAVKCTGCPEKLVFERFSLRGALLLHADREAHEKLRPPVSEQPPPPCGTGPHARVVERMADLLILVDREPGDFLRRFFLGVARHAHWSHCLPAAQHWARAGLKRFPKDGPLLLTLGIASENYAFHMRAPTSRSDGMSARQRDLWEDAQNQFEDALGADPELHEARLRLGRVLWRLKQPEPARVCLEALLARGPNASLQYLAHLFLGQVHEDAGRLTEAEMEYSAALAMRPTSEPAAVAVSYVRQLLGDPDSAREILSRSLEYARRRMELDPYVGYLMAHTAEGQRILKQLRAEITR